MGYTMLGLHFRDGLIHEIFPGDVERIWKMINFLVG